jgi:V/A-type H+-transporting ATPase subunit I
MKIKMNKYLFVGTKKNHDRFFEKAQKLGFMEFISAFGQKPHLFPDDVQKAKMAIKILSKHEKKKQKQESLQPIMDVINEITSTREKLDIFYEKKRALKVEMIRVKPFGTFLMKDIHKVEENSNRYIQFFMVRHDKIELNNLPEGFIYIQRVDNLDYFLYVGDKKFSSLLFTEVLVEKSYQDLCHELENLEDDIKEMEKFEIESCCFIKLIEEYIFARMNSINLNFAKQDVDYLLDDQLFVIDAWIPESKEKELEVLVDGLSIAIEKVAIEKDDKPPTYLENKGFSKMGEDLVYVYDTPDVTDKDPSAWVIWFFALFFGMIISDAGYGCIFLSLAIFFWFKLGKTLKGVGRRMLKILTLVSCSTVIWGVLVAGYFSVKLEPDNFFNRISIPYNLAIKKLNYHYGEKSSEYKEWVKEYPQIEDVDIPLKMLKQATKGSGRQKTFELMNELYDSIFLEIALIVGIFHLSISFLRNLYRNYAGIGWVVALSGGYLYFPKILDASSIAVYTGIIERNSSIILGERLLIGGIALAVFLSIVQARSISGIGSLVKIIEIFADTLSYLRLYALGLASIVLAGTFNDLGVAAGPMLGWIIILFGHSINICLGVMAGVIHGLRLNFLEWYHHCYEGGGRKYNPLRILKNE